MKIEGEYKLNWLDKLEKKLINTALKPESRIAFINKKRLEKINRLTNEINFTSSSIEDTEKEIINLNKNFDKAQQQIEKEKEREKSHYHHFIQQKMLQDVWKFLNQ